MKALLFLLIFTYFIPQYASPSNPKHLASNHTLKLPTYKAKVVHKQRDMVLETTAYCVTDDGGITSLGRPVVAGRTVAIDPDVIPYGSKVYFHSRKEMLTAEDCGGAIIGKRADIAMNTEPQCIAYGRRFENVTVYYPETEIVFYEE